MTLVQMAATRRHFCAGKQHYDTHFFVFTDRNASTGAVSDAGVTFIHKQRLGWPRDSDDRYSWLIEVQPLPLACYMHRQARRDPCKNLAAVQPRALTCTAASIHEFKPIPKPNPASSNRLQS
jgi:hypothetical protein